ncbi:MAG: hypothetical protein JSV88_14015, partial [Candidatus Aminicenantes bacterium]
KTGHIQDEAITSSKIKEADGTTDQDTTKGNGIKTSHIQNNAITEPKLENDSVSSAKIKEADGTTTQDTSKGYGIKTGHIQDEAITEKKLDEKVKSKLVTKGDNHTHSAEDVNALPISGGTVEGNIVIEGNLEVIGSLIGGLPIGTFLMYDGENWQDNSTLPGWFACIAENITHGCPNLVEKFIMGDIYSNRKKSGGENLKNISANELPKHKHSINHHHPTASTSTSNQSKNHSHQYIEAYSGITPGGPAPDVQLTRKQITSENLDNHNHSLTVQLPNYMGKSGYHIYNLYDKLQNQQHFDNRPSYYSLLFIRRCY